MKNTNIGGQAVLEGIMLRSPQRQAVAVRTPDGKIVVESSEIMSLAKRWPVLGFPLIRGCVAMYESIAGALSGLGQSARLSDPEEEITSLQMTVVAVFALLVGIGMFFLLPAVLVNPLGRWWGVNHFVLNIIEGLVRILFFVGYLVLVGLSRDIKRTFEYHGAEHKVIACWEQEKPLTPKDAATCSRLHPRCGTSFLLLVVVISILLFSFFAPASLWQKLALRLALLPVLTGIAYELIRWTAKSRSKLAKIVLAPGLLLQKLTTREPNLDQLEVALAALSQVVDPNVE